MESNQYIPEAAEVLFISYTERSGSSTPRSSSYVGQRSHTRRVQRAYIETVALALVINAAVYNEYRALEGAPRHWQL